MIGVAKKEPKTSDSYSHVRTKRASRNKPSPKPAKPVATVGPPKAAYSPGYITRKQPPPHIDTSKFNPDATIITECQRIDQTDLVILIDGSWSVTPDNFKRVQEFLGKSGYHSNELGLYSSSLIGNNSNSNTGCGH